MVNQQLLDYIKKQLQQGISREQIKSSLMTNGWQEEDIKEGFNALNSSVPTEQFSNFSNKKPLGISKTLMTSLVGIIIIGGGVYFTTQKIFKSEEEIKPSNEQVQQLPIQIPEETILPTPKQETPPVDTVLDCKQDFNCLIQASTNCKKVKVVNTSTVDIFGVKQITTSFFEIKGKEEDKCNFYLRTEKVDLVFPANIPTEVVNQQKEISKKIEGRDGTCKFNNSDLTAMLTRWQKGDFESGNVSCKLTSNGNVCKTEGGDFGKAECQGTYFEQPSL